MLNIQRISSFTNLKWANLEMIHPYHHLSLSIFHSAWPQIYPATRQESAKNRRRLIGSWLEIELVFLSKTSGYLLPAKVAEKAGLGSFMWNIVKWRELWKQRSRVKPLSTYWISYYHDNICLSLFLYLCSMVDFICSFFLTHLSHYFMLSLSRPKCWLCGSIIYVLLYFNKCFL
jgi:hypothetical protein